MTVISMLVLLSSALAIKCTNANVVILNTSGIAKQVVSECGRSLTLTCKVQKNTYSIVWKYADDISPIAKCVQNRCASNPAYHGQYNISFDKIRCVFDLTIIKVTMKDNGRKLVCSDGSHTDFKIISVRDYHLYLIEDRNSGTIAARSGCVSRDTDVSFKWMKTDLCSSIDSQFTLKVRFSYTTSCSNDYVCGIDQHIQYIEEVSFNLSGNRQLNVVAVYGNESKAPAEVVVRNMTLKGEKRACYYNQDKPSTAYIIAIAAGSGLGTILLLLLFIKFFQMVKYNLRKMFETIINPYVNQRDNQVNKESYENILDAENTFCFGSTNTTV